MRRASRAFSPAGATAAGATAAPSSCASRVARTVARGAVAARAARVGMGIATRDANCMPNPARPRHGLQDASATSRVSRPPPPCGKLHHGPANANGGHSAGRPELHRRRADLPQPWDFRPNFRLLPFPGSRVTNFVTLRGENFGETCPFLGIFALIFAWHPGCTKVGVGVLHPAHVAATRSLPRPQIHGAAV